MKIRSLALFLVLAAKTYPTEATASADVFFGKYQTELSTDKRPEASCLRDELEVFSLEKIFQEELQSLLSSAAASKKKAFASAVPVKGYKPTKKPLRQIDSIVEWQWDKEGSDTIANNVKRFKSIEYVDFKIFDYEISSAHLLLRARLDIRGLSKESRKVQDRMKILFILNKKDGEWAIASSKIISGATLEQTKSPAFVDVSKSTKPGTAVVDHAERAFIRDGAKLRSDLSLAIDRSLSGSAERLVLAEDGVLYSRPKAEGDAAKRQEAIFSDVQFQYGMSLIGADIDNDGLFDFALTNTNLSEFARVNWSCARVHKKRVFLKNDKGLTIAQSKSKDRTAKLIEFDKKRFDDPGESLGGATFIDYNNDGWVDLYVVNGLWSSDRSKPDSASLFAIATFLSGTSIGQNISASDSLKYFGFLKNQANYGGLAGFQRNRLYRNNRDGTFTDVAYLEGVDSEADGYGVMQFDYDSDGAVDLVLTNAATVSPQSAYPRVQVFKNATTRKSVGLTFESGEHSLEGLTVRASVGSWQQVAVLPTAAEAGKRPVIHFGLGVHDQIDLVEVFWPSGKKEGLRALKSGYHHLVEGTKK